MAPEIFIVAESIRDTENLQAERIATGHSLRAPRLMRHRTDSPTWLTAWLTFGYLSRRMRWTKAFVRSITGVWRRWKRSLPQEF
jgi:hypothetical protein